MKKKILMLVVLIISIFTVQVNAKQFYVKDNIKIDEQQDYSVFAAGTEIDISSFIDGSTFVAGEEINITSSQDIIFAAGEEIKIPYLGHCYRKAEAGKRGEYYTHHQNRSPSKGEKISKSNNVQDQQFLFHFASCAVLALLYSFSKKPLLPYFHFPNV